MLRVEKLLNLAKEKIKNNPIDKNSKEYDNFLKQLSRELVKNELIKEHNFTQDRLSEEVEKLSENLLYFIKK